MPRRRSREQGVPHAHERRKRRWRNLFFPRVSERVFDAQGGYGSPYLRYLIFRTHHDSPLTPRARALWWLVGGLLVGGFIAIVIYYAAR